MQIKQNWRGLGYRAAWLSVLGLLALGIGAQSWVGAATGANSPPGASIPITVNVPTSMRSAPFDHDRTLNVPPHFSIAVFARVPNARFMAVAPNGDVLVSDPGDGKVVLLRPDPAGGDPKAFDFAKGLRSPHAIIFHTMGAVTYVYISETNQINRYVYAVGDTSAHDRQIIIKDLPDRETPALHGAYNHPLKNLAIDSHDHLYVAIGSSSNADPSDQAADPVRGAIYMYNADGTNGRLFAKGIRNAEGLAIVPGTDTLWVAVNNRDNLACPTTGSGCTNGRIVAAYVDNHPPEEFMAVRDGGNYGWPFCNPNPDSVTGMVNMPFERDVQNNRSGDALNCDSADRVNMGIQAHSAPLGLSFLGGSKFPALYRDGAAIGLHGSWNRTTKTGYKVAYFPWDTATQTPGAQIDLVTGWLPDGSSDVWGRPVDAVPDAAGNLLISDDANGTIYKLIPDATLMAS